MSFTWLVSPGAVVVLDGDTRVEVGDGWAQVYRKSDRGVSGYGECRAPQNTYLIDIP